MKLYPANILFPYFSSVDGSKWATVACDQYTSEPEYWERVRKYTDGVPTTLDLMLPEVWLGEAQTRTPAIHKNMEKYLSDGIFAEHPDCGVYLERRQNDGRIRRGLIVCIDLEDYDYRPGASSPIRATEKTVVERIPPRLAVRRGAPLEMPHVMLLSDDPSGKLFAPFYGKAADAYEFELMENGGSVRASFVSAEEISAFEDRLNESARKRGVKFPMILAVGDGNHSLATAKAAYEELKQTLSEEEAKKHPARFALCEIVDLGDDALEFEPIYRIVDTPDPDALIEAFGKYTEGLHGNMPEQKFSVIKGDDGKCCEITVKVASPELSLPVATLQRFLDEYAKSHPDIVTDYIHGDDTLRRLSLRKGTVGFLFDGMKKGDLFSAVESDGALPRKTFSMGHANDKRFYIECRKIR